MADRQTAFTTCPPCSGTRTVAGRYKSQVPFCVWIKVEGVPCIQGVPEVSTSSNSQRFKGIGGKHYKCVIPRITLGMRGLAPMA